MADTYDPILGLILQATGGNNNNWGNNLNNSMIKIAARATAGNISRVISGGTLDLSGSPPPASMRQDIDFFQTFSGTLSSNQTVIVPSLSKSWVFSNSTAGGFQLFIKTAGQTTASAAQIPQGTSKFCICDGVNVFRMDDSDIATLVHSPLSGPPAGTLVCNGQSLLRADYTQLFNKISTLYGTLDGAHFNVPDYVTGNRFLRAAGGALGIATVQNSQNIAHNHGLAGGVTVGSLGTSGVGDHAHTASPYDPGHAHGSIPGDSQLTTGGYVFVGPGGGASYAGFGGAANGGTAAAGTGWHFWNGVTFETTYGAGSHSHSVTGAPSHNFSINNDGGAEARPNCATVLICIKF